MQKKAVIGHIEIIISFIIFIGFLVFLFYIFTPLKKSGVNEGMLNLVEEVLRKNAEIPVISASVILNTSSPGYPFQPCFRLGGSIAQPGGGIGDVILVTDISSSMRYRLDAPGVNGDFPEKACDDPTLFSPSTRRINLVKCLAKNFTKAILSIPGNRVGLAAFHNKANLFHALSDDLSTLVPQIDSYSGAIEQGTCACCGVNRAYEQFQSSLDPSRKRFLVLLTDGESNHRCTPSGANFPPVETCNAVMRSFQGTLTTGLNCGGSCTERKYFTPLNNTLWSANRTHTDLGVKVSTIGMSLFGCTNAILMLSEAALVGGGVYRQANDGQSLADIYAVFAETIIQESFIEPLKGTIPSTYKIAAESFDQDIIGSNDSDAIAIQFDGSSYNLHFSDQFTESGMDSSPCKNISKGNYSIGLVQERKLLSKTYLLELNSSYYNGYLTLKNSLNIPQGSEFGFIVRDVQGNILMQAINRKATKVHVQARDIPFEMIDGRGKIQEVIMNLQVW